MNIPYIKIRQKGEIFFLTKFKASELKERIHFHVRDPYIQDENNDSDKFQQYMERLSKKGLNVGNTDKEIQRRLSIGRINEISEYIDKRNSNFLPNTVILSVDVSNSRDFEKKYLQYESNEIGEFEFDDDVRFMIIDGQHRLAGIFCADESTIEELEIPAVILFNVSLSTAAKLFADINGKVKPVNRSLVYDLYGEIKDMNYEQLKKVHLICKNFYDNDNSPLLRQIKMLGVGNGAISQAFFIDYVMDAIKVANIENESAQYIYNQLFYYFKAFQIIFPNDWPVPEKYDSYDELTNHAGEVLKVRKSQLVKTNGFGAIMRLFPLVYARVDKGYSDYYNFLRPLEGQISWMQDNEMPQGTGKGTQMYILNKIKKILDI